MIHIITGVETFIVYGAGHLGRACYDHLSQQGFDVLAFLDKVLSHCRECENVPIIDPEKNNIPEEWLKETFMIIATNNFFSHAEIAREMFDLGFQKILYKRNIILYESKSINNTLYDKIITGESIIGEKFEIAYDFMPIIDDMMVAKQNGNSVIVKVPVECLYFKGKNGTDSTPFVLSNPFINLYGAFGGLKVEYNDFLEHYHLTKIPESDNNDLTRVIANRQNIYNSMSMAFNYDPEFFTRHPIEVRWDNEHNFFIVNDGMNRSSFLYTRGIRALPCRCSVYDYEKWVNKGALKPVIDYIMNNKILNLPTPIFHPYFLLFPYRHEGVHITRFEAILKFLKDNEIYLNEITIAIFNASIGYFSQLFYKAGANVTVYEKDTEKLEILSIFNKLHYCDNIRLKKILLGLDKYDIVIDVNFEDGEYKTDVEKLLKHVKKFLIFENFEKVGTPLMPIIRDGRMKYLTAINK